MREADRSGLIKLVKLPGLPTFECYTEESNDKDDFTPDWVDW
jgi:hypothetical protein